MSLDINTPKGQETLAQEQEALRIIGVDFVSTPKSEAAVVDGFFVRDGNILAVVEIKCRQLTFKQLMITFKGEWLITHSKLEKAASIAKALCVPLVGVCYLVPDNVALVKKLTDSDGNLINLIIKETETQATVNGGTAVRTNAFVDMSDATMFTDE